MKTLLLTAAIASLGAPALAQDRAEMERTPIVGNRELPKVLYIVPWKKATAPPLLGRPAVSVLDEPPTAIDRDVLRRQVRLDGRLQQRETPTSSPVSSGEKR
jgi:hypothetical protein